MSQKTLTYKGKKVYVRKTFNDLKIYLVSYKARSGPKFCMPMQE